MLSPSSRGTAREAMVSAAEVFSTSAMSSAAHPIRRAASGRAASRAWSSWMWNAVAERAGQASMSASRRAIASEAARGARLAHAASRKTLSPSAGN